MNLIPKLKIIPLATVIFLGLSLSPALSLAADKGHDKDYGRQQKQQSHDTGKSNFRQPRKEVTVAHGYDGRGPNRGVKNYHKTPIVKYDRHVYYRGVPYRHHAHDRVNYIVVDNDCRDCHDHYVEYDDVRFKIGVHTGNFDIVFRD